MDSRSRAIRRSFHAIALSVVLIGAPGAGRTATRYVTNDGVDSSSCGSTSDHAYRSISQGIENASDGDTILVGAGRYGDLNGNGDYSDPGDEHPMNTGEDVSCIVCITKSVTILSYSGTAATTIEGGGEYQSVVQPLVDRVTFGAKNQGFTIAGGLYGFWLHEQGLNNGNPGTLKHGISVVGNVAVNSSIGFEFDGQPYRPPQGCPDSLCLSTGRVVFAQNTALNTGTGFAAVQNLAAGPVVFQDNLAEFASGTGFNVSPGFQYGQFFSAISAGGIQLIHNVATHSGYGFGTVLPGIMETTWPATTPWPVSWWSPATPPSKAILLPATRGRESSSCTPTRGCRWCRRS